MPGKSNARLVRLLQQPLTLPCGAVLPNRLAKAAMTEGLATGRGVPGEQLERLYGLWSDGGAGLLLCGNIQVDADHLERPGNVVIDQVPDRAMQRALSSLAAAGTRAGNHFWAQVSHAGRQTMKSVNPHPKAPSAVKLGLPGGQFGEPVALTEGEIAEIVRRFAQCAAAVQAAGFTGVQVHAAHGYLLSQFLSPRSNQRSDRYGGDLSNRARILLEVVAAVRTAVGPDFPVAVKLNKERVSIPLMVTGGFRRREAMEQAIASGGADLIGIGHERQRSACYVSFCRLSQGSVAAESVACRERCMT